MTIYVKIILNIIHYAHGTNIYKALKNVTELRSYIINLAKTLQRLVEVKTSDEQVIEGRSESRNNYEFPECKLHEVISYCTYLIFSENFSDLAFDHQKYRLAELSLQSGRINEFVKCRFDINKLMNEMKLEEIKDCTDGIVLTPAAWTNAWNQVLYMAANPLNFKPLEFKHLQLSQIPCGFAMDVIDKNGKVTDSDEIKEGYSTQEYMVPLLNENEIPKELMLAIMPANKKISALAERSFAIDKAILEGDYNVHNYLFGDITFRSH